MFNTPSKNHQIISMLQGGFLASGTTKFEFFVFEDQTTIFFTPPGEVERWIAW